jgi:hypothetical protein
MQQQGTAKSVLYVVCSTSIARQRATRHVPAEVYHGTIGRPVLGNGAVNTPTNC